MVDTVEDCEEQIRLIDTQLSHCSDAERPKLLAAREELDEMLEMLKELEDDEAEATTATATEAESHQHTDAAAQHHHHHVEPSSRLLSRSSATSEPASIASLLPPAPAIVWAPGQQCKAKWSGDGKYYDATVLLVVEPSVAAADEAETRVKVKFDEYDAEEVVPMTSLKPRSSSTSAAASSVAAAATTASSSSSSSVAAGGRKRSSADAGLDEARAVVEAGQLAGASADQIAAAAKAAACGPSKEIYEEIPIPKSLEILPSDSAQVREKKKKRIKSIKSKNRLAKLEREKAKSASTWSQFLNKKASAKAVTGFASSKKKKQSMFRSPDTIEGKVGVTGSGKGTTAFHGRTKVQAVNQYKPPPPAAVARQPNLSAAAAARSAAKTIGRR